MIDHVEKELNELEQKLRMSLSQFHMGLEFELDGKKYNFYQPSNKEEVIEQYILKEEFIRKVKERFKPDLVLYHATYDTETVDPDELDAHEYILKDFYHFKFAIGYSSPKPDKIVSNLYLVDPNSLQTNVVDRDIGDCPCWFEEKFPGLFDQGGKLGVFALRECDKKCRD
jgi:hypothetical protein